MGIVLNRIYGENDSQLYENYRAKCRNQKPEIGERRPETGDQSSVIGE
jgi:hypothetical protein